MESLKSDDIYIIISIVIIIVLIFTLFNIKEKKNNTISKVIDNVLIETNLGIIKIQPDILDRHLSTIKMNLTKLNIHNITSENNKILEKSLNDMKFVIKNSNYNQENTINDTYMEQYLLFKRMENIQHMQQNDLSSESNEIKELEKYKLQIVELIINIEIVILLLQKNKIHKSTRIVLGNLHNFIKLISKKQDGEVDETYDDIFCELSEYMTDENAEIYDLSGPDIINTFIPKSKILPKINKTKLSQNILCGFGTRVEDGEKYSNDEKNIVYSNEFQPSVQTIRNEIKNDFENKFENKLYNSQLLGMSEETPALTRKHNSNPFIAFCNIDKIKEEIKIKKQIITDTNFNRSLRNDYDFLED